MNKGQLLVNWIHSIIHPIIKADKPAFEATSYRPIILTSVLYKLLERHTANRLRWYMEANKVLNRVQSGFRQGCSCLDHILRLSEFTDLTQIENSLSTFLSICNVRSIWFGSTASFKLKLPSLSGNIYITGFVTFKQIVPSKLEFVFLYLVFIG